MWQLPHAQIVDDQQRNRRQVGEKVFAGAIERRVREFLEEGVGFAIQDPIALLDPGAANG